MSVVTRREVLEIMEYYILVSTFLFRLKL